MSCSHGIRKNCLEKPVCNYQKVESTTLKGDAIEKEGGRIYFVEEITHSKVIHCSQTQLSLFCRPIITHSQEEPAQGELSAAEQERTTATVTKILVVASITSEEVKGSGRVWVDRE